MDKVRLKMDMKKLESTIKENQLLINKYKQKAKHFKEVENKIDCYKYINLLIPLQQKNKK